MSFMTVASVAEETPLWVALRVFDHLTRGSPSALIPVDTPLFVVQDTRVSERYCTLWLQGQGHITGAQVCVTLQIPPMLPQMMSSVNSEPKTQTVPAEIRVHNLTYSDSEHFHLINTELFLGYFQGQALCAAMGTNTGKRYKVYAFKDNPIRSAWKY